MKLSATVKQFIRAYVKAREEKGFYIEPSEDEYTISKLLDMMTYSEREAIENYITEIIKK